MPRPRIPDDVLDEAVRRRLAGESYSKIARIVGYSEQGLGAALEQRRGIPRRRQRARSPQPKGETGYLRQSISADVHEALQARAQELNVSISYLVDEALRLYLDLPWAEHQTNRRMRMRKYMRAYHERTRPGPQPEPQDNPALPPHGVIVVDDDGELVQCHVCGDWHKALGMHVRQHGLTAADYREQYGLARGLSLSSPRTQERQRALALAKIAAGKLEPHPEELRGRGREVGLANRLSSRLASSAADRSRT